VGQHGSQLRMISLCAIDADYRDDPITDVGITAMAVGCPKLVTVMLGGSRTTITDRGIKELSTHCNLQTLDLMGSYGITDESLLNLGTSCPDLRSVCLVNCVSITADGIRNLIHLSCNLVKIEIGGESESGAHPLELAAIQARYKNLEVKI